MTKTVRFVEVTDDWYPCRYKNKIEVILAIIKERNFIRISAWGADDFGMEKDFEYSEENIKKAREFFENIPEKGIDVRWFAKNGFVRA